MKSLMLLITLLMLSFTSVCQTPVSTLKPILIKEGGNITYYAFTRSQVVDILKCYAERDIHAEKIDSLQSTIRTYEVQTEEYKQLMSALEQANIKLYKLTEQYDMVNRNYESIQVDYVTIKNSLEYKIKKKNKVILLLSGANVITIGILLLVLL